MAKGMFLAPIVTADHVTPSQWNIAPVPTFVEVLPTKPTTQVSLAEPQPPVSLKSGDSVETGFGIWCVVHTLPFLE